MFEEWNSYQFPAALGFVAIGLVYLRRKEKVVINEGDEDSEQVVYKRTHLDNLTTALLVNFVPFNFLSILWGKMHNIDIPSKSLRVALFKWWTKTFNCNLDEMEKNLDDYRNMAQFFTRELKNGVRKLDMKESSLVSPVDGRIYSFGSLKVDESGSNSFWNTANVEQVKGRTYQIRELLGEFSSYLSNKKSKKLNYIVLYLSPGDYHHYHSPHEFHVKERRHFPGELYPVRRYFAERVNNLYGVNERVAILGKWREGFFSYVAVGAHNVGSMTLEFDPELKTNEASIRNRDCRTKVFDEEVSLLKGEKVGTFHLGSTVVLVFESDASFEFTVCENEVIKIGQMIGTTGGKESPKEVMLAPPWPKAQN